MHLTATRQTLQLMIDLHVSSLVVQLDTLRRTVGNRLYSTQRLSRKYNPKTFQDALRQK